MKRVYAPWRAVYLMSEKADECLFCVIERERDDEKNRVLHRADHNYIVVNAYPYTTGHVMVVCNRHVESFSELTDDERLEMMDLIAQCEKAILDAYRPGGINVGANLGQSAGAGILGHLHVHLVPRWHGDTNFMTAIGETRVVSEDLLDTYKRLKAYFG
ncbi:MAG: HIT domain-containing protein [Candidatus Latescibacterota bacterium]|nr:MAG: HIT domain-containing protein [Candidatus Latescibacterota bacterium]